MIHHATRLPTLRPPPFVLSSIMMATALPFLGLLCFLFGGAACVRRTFHDAETDRGARHTIRRFWPVVETISDPSAQDRSVSR